MASRSHRKFLQRNNLSISFKDRTAIGQYIRKLDNNEIKIEDVPENIRALIGVNKPAEVAIEEVADDILSEVIAPSDQTIIDVPFEPVEQVVEHVHSENCDHSH